MQAVLADPLLAVYRAVRKIIRLVVCRDLIGIIIRWKVYPVAAYSDSFVSGPMPFPEAPVPGAFALSGRRLRVGWVRGRFIGR